MFRALPKSVRKGTSRALLEAGAEMAGIIKRAVPVDDGALRDSVQVKRGKSAKRQRGQVVEAAGADADLTVRVTEGDRKAFYAAWVEFGTRNRPAQPHFFPSWRANRKRLIRRIRAVQRKAIREAAKNV